MTTATQNAVKQTAGQPERGQRNLNVPNANAEAAVSLPPISRGLTREIGQAVSNLFRGINNCFVNPAPELRAQATAALKGLGEAAYGPALSSVRALELMAIVKGPQAIKAGIENIVQEGSKTEQALALQLGVMVSQWTANSQEMLNYLSRLGKTMGSATPGFAHYSEAVAFLMQNNPAKALSSINKAELKGFDSGPGFNLLKGLTLLAKQGAEAAEPYLRSVTEMGGQVAKPFAEVAAKFLASSAKTAAGVSQASSSAKLTLPPKL